ncbi:MAG: metallophosphoesterase [Cytophagales bacterium]|jgi:predicted MPP superfamily phosphohydrolase|nr:metallophosphoesterase [Cytophagales bacterium]MCA6366620.1 metallophosphoesterase [Cytophagales bacterium]MCA6370031.1 metallophosphoesterase [Cytophagales bacterium]MCA6375212.1 metallophosphoesterase [Cytophagales bacterium]MCA6384267.1 metallophosphoesterase [Cytophagales bacterium]
MLSIQTLLFRALLLFILSVLLSYYSLIAFQSLVKLENKNTTTTLYWVFDLFITIISLASTVYFYSNEGKASKLFNYLAFAGVSWMITKFFINIVMVLGDSFRLLEFVSNWISLKFNSTENQPIFLESRRRFVGHVALMVASVPLAGLLYGMTKGKYDYKIHKETLYFDDLPHNFDGFTITQISDIHSGSFDSVEDVRRGIDLVNQQQSDMFVFTGDLVNNLASEIEPWKEIFSTIKAPYGQYSIMGNHDYGDYVHWDDDEEKRTNLKQLHKAHEELGFRLLLNDNVVVKKGEQQVSLIGVENWGKPPFAQYGKIEHAIGGVSHSDFKILLSHDPSHWEGEILSHRYNFHLTLSGHTHGAQMGIEIPLLKWSPVKYIYKQWAGLYSADNRYLYVNRGFGFLGYPGRLGIWPEITVLTLKKSVQR